MLTCYSMGRSLRIIGWTAIAICVVSSPARGEVSRFEASRRTDVAGGRSFGASGPYERIVGRFRYAIDPKITRNMVIADLDKGQKGASGRVEFWGDVIILRPRDARRGNGIALFDIVNRGRTSALGRFNLRSDRDNPSDEFGDGFLLNRGYTIVQVGWEFDLPQNGTAIQLEAPVASGIGGFARATFIPVSATPTFTVGDLAGYTPSSLDASENTLSVRDTPLSSPVAIPRSRWRLYRNVVTLEGGFEPGRIYEVAYTATDPPIAGLGFAAVRDAVAWLKHSPGSPIRPKQTLAFGSSQTGRFLREFVYSGFNTDEQSRRVFDAVFAHTAGTGAVNLNRRWATPVSLSTHTAMFFPFADTSQRDPVTGVQDGILENPRARVNRPRIFWTNSATEYRQKAAALTTTAPDGSSDLKLPNDVRSYFLAGTDHGGRQGWPPNVTNGEQVDNPTSYIWALRALLVAMEKWLLEEIAPPPSRYPRLDDGTLVRVETMAFPALPGVTSPRTAPLDGRGVNSFLPKGGGTGTPLPFFVPQVDDDGNEISGIRLPEVVVPLATTTGWNFRNPRIGGTSLLYPLLGSYIPFPSTKKDREHSHDPRMSIEERYSSRDQYLKRIENAALALVRDRYLLVEDITAIIQQAADHWDLRMKAVAARQQ